MSPARPNSAIFRADCARIALSCWKVGGGERDESANLPPRHSIPIKGKKKSSIREGTASLKDAAKIYRDFRNGFLPDARAPRTVSGRGASISRTASAMAWPEWERPTVDDIRVLLELTAKHMRFLSPRIVGVIAEDNVEHMAEWRQRLDSCGVDPDAYLWSGSPCAFPGVRRHSGRAEIRDFGNRDFSNLTGALVTDDNSYPKQVWAFVFTGKKFGNLGPSGYRLAHLFDHKGGTRFAEEVDCSGNGVGAVPGLYTSAANSAYICEELIDPTDFNVLVRRVIQQRARALYGDVCEILPPGCWLHFGADDEALAEGIEWAEPVGDPDAVHAFLDWRGGVLRDLFEQAEKRTRERI